MKLLTKLITLGITASMAVNFIGCSSSQKKAEKTELTISAAASLKESMAEIEPKFEAEHPDINLTFNFGSSGSLQKQIENGAPCDLFISAAQTQMNNVDDEGLILKDSKKDLLENSLVLIAPKDSTISDISDLTSDSVKHIAVGEVSSVPAGKYADEVLTNLNMKDSLNSKLTYAKDVKEVLSWVASSNAEVGFVYKSDTVNVDSVKIIEEIPSEYHNPIIYPVGIVNSSSNADAAKIFEDYLFTDTCQDIFKNYGYNSIQ